MPEPGRQPAVCYESSFCLSSDVTAAYDPNFAEVYEKRNESRVNYGLGICKYTGARGKSGSSGADAETVAYVRRVLDNAGVVADRRDGKATPAAAAPWPSTWPTATSPPSTPVCRF